MLHGIPIATKKPEATRCRMKTMMSPVSMILCLPTSRKAHEPIDPG
jgi:hypothetical protein